MAMQHISEPMAAALETIRVKAMAQPQVWIAAGRFVVNRFSQRRIPVARARAQDVPAMIEDALSRPDDIQFEFALRDLNHMLRAIREAERSLPRPRLARWLFLNNWKGLRDGRRWLRLPRSRRVLGRRR